MLSDVLPLRHASRELVRELGFLEPRNEKTKLPHSYSHALIEIGARAHVSQTELGDVLRLEKSTTSRIVADLVTRRWVRVSAHPTDKRARVLALTRTGRAKLLRVHRDANDRVERALGLLSEGERAAVVSGIQAYANALARSRRSAKYAIRPVSAVHRRAVASLIRTVMPEFGAKGPGFAILDPEVDDMFGAYRGRKSMYFVVTRPSARGESGSEVVAGGGGFAALSGSDDAGVCELRKMYFLPELRGLGFGRKLLGICIESAKKAGYSRMYLETLETMHRARALYEQNGFRRLERALGQTGHFGCDVFYIRDLR